MGALLARARFGMSSGQILLCCAASVAAVVPSTMHLLAMPYVPKANQEWTRGHISCQGGMLSTSSP